MTVREKFDAYLAAHWTATPILAAENQVQEAPADLSEWLSVDYESYGEEVISIGNPGKNCHRATGLIILTAWIASGTATATALQHIEDLRTLLRHKDLGDGLVLTTASPAQDMGSSQGDWYGYTTEIDYTFDYLA